MTVLAVLAILTIVGLIVAGAVRKERQRAAAAEQLLIQSGFSRSASDTAHLETVVRSLRESPRFKVSRPWKCRTGGGDVYWYEASSEDADSEHRIAADEFLCTLKRPSEAPLLLYLEPVKLGKGFGASLIDKLLVVTAPRGLHKLDPPTAAPSTGILAAFGPKGASWSQLVDSEQLDLLARGAQHGVFVIRCRGEHCALELFGAYARKAIKSVDWNDTWAFVRRVAAASPAARPPVAALGGGTKK